MLTIKSYPIHDIPIGSYYCVNWTEDIVQTTMVDFITSDPNACKPTNTLTTLQNVNKVFFVPRTRFNRELFKQLYPNIKILKDHKDADAIIYNESALSANNILHGQPYYIINDTFGITKRIARWALSKRHYTKIPKLSFFDPQFGYFNSKVEIKYGFKKNVLNVVKWLNLNIPVISTADVFISSETEFKKEELSLEDMQDLYKQILSSNLESRKLAIDLVAQLDTKRYLDVQTYMYLIYKRRSTRRNLSQRARLLKNTLEKTVTDPQILKILNNTLYSKRQLQTIHELVFGRDPQKYTQFIKWIKDYNNDFVHLNRGLYDRNW